MIYKQQSIGCDPEKWHEIKQGGVPVQRKYVFHDCPSAWTCDRVATITPSGGGYLVTIFALDELHTQAEVIFGKDITTLPAAKAWASKKMK